MSKAMTLNVRIGGTLGDFVAMNVGDQGAYENVSEYVRDLIRRDKERTEAEQFDRLRAELTRAFAAPQSSYAPLDADAVLARNRAKRRRYPMCGICSGASTASCAAIRSGARCRPSSAWTASIVGTRIITSIGTI